MPKNALKKSVVD